MGYRDNLDDTWGDLAPDLPEERSRWPVFLAIGAAALLLLCVCGVGGYLAYQEFLVTPEAIVPAVPTLTVSGEAVAEASPTAAVQTGVTASPSPMPEGVASPTSAISPAPTVTVQTPTEAAPTEAAPTEAAPTEAVQSGSAVEAVRLAAAPVIDGSLAEWSAVPAWSSAFVVHQVAGWDGSDDLQATWRLAWDASNLYIGVEVIDDILVQTQSGNQIYRGDGLEMQIDTNRTGDFGPGLSPDDFQFNFSPGDFVTLPPSAFRSQGSTDGRILDAPGGHHVNMAAQRTALGYNVEAAIPWSDMNMAPTEGLILGLALNANDNDTPGTAVQEVMKSHVTTRTLTDPTGWGTLLLR